MSQNSTEPETFGDILRRERENAGITQQELAERAGLSRNAISSLERGERRRPYPFTVRSLVAALRLSLEDGVGLAAAVPARAKVSDGDRPPDSRPDSAPEAVPALAAMPLFGREQEVAEAVSLLMGGTTRLLTLLGPGGVGKTALSLAVADSLAPQMRDGVTIVSLVPISDPSLVLPAITFAIGLREESERPVIQTLIAGLRDRQMLLLLDNAEHLTAIGPALADLLAACPSLKILVTSREALHVRDERILIVPPLALPEMTVADSRGYIADVPAVALFVERARAVRSDFRLTGENAPVVAAICARLDGLPLAIELAAARVQLLPPAALLARLERRLPLLGGGPRDAPERHRTLRQTIAWSYDLLTSNEQILFQRIAVFAGGATLESMEALSWALGESGLADADVLDLLGQLINKSLLRSPGLDAEYPRLEMLETVREYAWERLSESGEQDTVERAHALHFVALAERAAPELVGPDQERWLALLDAERFNLDAALTWLIETGDIETGLRLVSSLHTFQYLRGYHSAARRWQRLLLERSGGIEADGPAHLGALRAKVFRSAGTLARAQGDSREAIALLERSLSISVTQADPAETAIALLELANAANDSEAYDRAERLYAESQVLMESVGNRRGVALILTNRGVLVEKQGNLNQATQLYEESLSAFEELGIAGNTARAQNNLANALVLRGEPERAGTLFRQSLASAETIGDALGIAISLEGLADIARLRGSDDEAIAFYKDSLARFQVLEALRNQATNRLGLSEVLQRRGDSAQALTCAKESLALAQEVGDARLIADAFVGLGNLAWKQRDRSGAAEQYREALRLYQGMDTAAGLPACMEGFAPVMVSEGSPDTAVQLWAAATVLRIAQGVPVPAASQTEYERALDVAREALAPDDFDRAWAAGEALTADQAVVFALESA